MRYLTNGPFKKINQNRMGLKALSYESPRAFAQQYMYSTFLFEVQIVQNIIRFLFHHLFLSNPVHVNNTDLSVIDLGQLGYTMEP